jgi:hypothetical protein
MQGLLDLSSFAVKLISLISPVSLISVAFFSVLELVSFFFSGWLHHVDYCGATLVGTMLQKFEYN